MKKAAIDIGTNSTRLFIAEVKDGTITDSLIRETIITRLGEGVDKNKSLKPEAIKRTVKVIKRYADLIDKNSVKDVKAVATSAVREAKNSNEIMTEVSSKLGIEVEVIDGAKEASLSYRGALSDDKINKSGKQFMVVDIGGGSTEIIFGDKKKIFSKNSIDIGCVRLTELFLKDDPPSINRIKASRDYVGKKLDDLYSGKLPDTIKREDLSAILVAGTATSLVAIDKSVEPYDPKKIHATPFSRLRTEYVLLKLSKMKRAKLRHLKGLDPKRADVIVAGAAIQAEIMSYFKLDRVVVSEADILDGLVLADKL